MYYPKNAFCRSVTSSMSDEEQNWDEPLKRQTIWGNIRRNKKGAYHFLAGLESEKDREREKNSKRREIIRPYDASIDACRTASPESYTILSSVSLKKFNYNFFKPLLFFYTLLSFCTTVSYFVSAPITYIILESLYI